MNAAVQETNSRGVSTEATLRAARRQQRSNGRKTKRALVKHEQLPAAFQETVQLEEYLLSNAACVNTSFNTEAAVNGSPSRTNTKVQRGKSEQQLNNQNETSVGNAVHTPIKINKKSRSLMRDNDELRAYEQEEAIWSPAPSDAVDDTLSSLSLSNHWLNSTILTSEPKQSRKTDCRHYADRIEQLSKQFGHLAMKSRQSTRLTSYKPSTPRQAHVMPSTTEVDPSINWSFTARMEIDATTTIELQELDNRLARQSQEQAAMSTETRRRLLQETNDQCLRDKFKQERQLQRSVQGIVDHFEQIKKHQTKRGDKASAPVKRKSIKSCPTSKASSEGKNYKQSSKTPTGLDGDSFGPIGVQISTLPRRRRQREQGPKRFWTGRLMCWIRPKKPKSLG